MKKIIFYAAAIAAMAACSEAMVEDITPEVEVEGNALHEVTISASTSEEAESRVTINEDADNWVVNWEATDALLAAEAITDGGKYTFSLSDGDGTSSATFTGSVGDNDYRLIYPATCSSHVSGTNFAMDLTSQVEGGGSMFMISKSKIASSETNPSASMKQIGAVVDLTMNFESSYNEATIESIEVSGFNSRCYISLSEDFADATDYTTPTASTITITDGATVIASQKAIVRFNILETTIANGSEVTVTAYVNNGSTVTPLTTTLTADSEMNFARAQHHSIGCTLAEVNSTYWTDSGIVATSFNDSESVGTSADDPIEISTAKELALIAKSVNDNTNTYTHFKLINDIDLTGYKWEAIGNSSYQFQGTFDGDNYTISGLYINESTDYQGLFGAISGATIENLSVSGSVNSSANSVGGIVAYSATPTSTITNCHNRCSVTATGTYTGGIVGYNLYADITNCSNSGAIYAGNNNVGGIAGYNLCDIDNCYNTGSVTGASYYTGGVVGYNKDCDIKNSYNAGVVNGKTQVGGVAGYLYFGSKILNCYNTASVTGSSTCVGGVVGQSDTSASDCYLYNSYNRGSVTGSDYVGGVVGQCQGKSWSGVLFFSYVKNCYSASGVTSSDSGSNVGGVIGQIGSYSSVEYCYWDSNLYTGSGIGSGSGTSITGYSTADMTDGTTVVNLLKGQTSGMSGAKTWVQGADGYPTLDL